MGGQIGSMGGFRETGGASGTHSGIGSKQDLQGQLGRIGGGEGLEGGFGI